jgi:phosphoribosyl-ATP pyrophosphohydrolase/phosphoribosyl-AMP cyclohydrolase/histidinol dehydrogenase
MTMLRRIAPQDVARAIRQPTDRQTLTSAAEIVDAIRTRGIPALREYAERFGERTLQEPLVLGPTEMRAALESLDPTQAALLERTAARIRVFAEAQRESIRELDIAIPGGRTGHTIEPVVAAGCYAPAGRYPLPSSVLMTAVTARVAGCDRVVVASPGARPVMLAAAAVAGADKFLAVGGAHAIAAMAYGCAEFQACDVIVGPGNKWVTAAKQLVSGVVGIDMLAGPSELLVIADESANPALIAIDLLAQAEHDTDAVPMLVATSSSLADAVEAELTRLLGELDTRETAATALRNGFACVVSSLDEARALADRIAAEHVEILLSDPEPFARSLRNAGALFVGSRSAEVFGDYGAGPNHTLPTGGAARFQAGLSVSHFLRLRTWLKIDEFNDARELIDDAVALAQIEGLSGHRAAAIARTVGGDVKNG